MAFLSHPLGELRGKIGALSIPRWKARDRQTDRQTDRRTDRIMTPKTVLLLLQRTVNSGTHMQSFAVSAIGSVFIRSNGIFVSFFKCKICRDTIHKNKGIYI